MPGIVTLGVLLLGVVTVLRLGRMGSVRGKTVSLRVLAQDARGMMRGAPVWLAGKPVGVVRGITFRPTRVDSAPPLVLQVDVAAEYAPFIRRDARARIRSSGQLLGAPVVAIHPGTGATPPLRPGAAIPAMTQLDPQQTRVRVALLSYEFTTTLRNVSQLARQLDTTMRRVDRLRTGSTVDLASTAARLRALAAHKRGGTLARLASDSTLLGRARRTVAQAESLAATLRDRHRAADGAALGASVRRLRDRIAAVQALLAESRGTAGRLLHDRALQQELARLERERRAIAALAQRGALFGGGTPVR